MEKLGRFPENSKLSSFTLLLYNTSMGLFSTTVQVRVGDFNYGNHLGNAEFFYLVHEARLRFLENIGQSEIDFFGTGLIMSEASVQFKQQVKDRILLLFEISIKDVKRSSFSILYKVSDSQSEVLIANFSTKMVCFDYTSQKPVRIPKDFIDWISSNA